MALHPIEDLAASLYTALLRDLPSEVIRVRDTEAWNKIPKGEQTERFRRSRAGDQTAIPMMSKKRRPFVRDVTLEMFVQTWPSSALGFTSTSATPGETPACTVVVSFRDAHAVYFGGRYAYVVTETESGRTRQDAGWESFRSDLRAHRLVDCAAATKRYRAVRFHGEAAGSET